MTDRWSGLLGPEERARLRASSTVGQHAAGRRRRPGRCRPPTGGDPISGARWYLRLRGDEKDFVTVWLTIRQRTLHHETQVMPAPETNIEATFEYLLKKNADLLGMRFALGPEDAVYLVGEFRWSGSTRKSSTGSSGRRSPTSTTVSRRRCPSAIEGRYRRGRRRAAMPPS